MVMKTRTHYSTQPPTHRTLSTGETIARADIEVDGRRVHYQYVTSEAAPGLTPLVLLHGLGGNTTWWDENMPALGHHYPVYALDLPGFGRSQPLANRGGIHEQALHVRRWLDAMGLSQVHLLGHSMGGQVALEVALAEPERVAKLILVAPAGTWPSLGRWLRWNMGECPRPKVPLAFAMRIATGTLRTSPLTIARSFRAIVGHRAEPSLQQVAVPTLVLWGTADAVLPPELASRVAAAIGAQASIAYVTDGTHNLMTDQAVRFNTVLLEFLRE